MKKNILIKLTLISLSATLLSGCSVLFTPTETHAYVGSGLVSTVSADLSENTSTSQQITSSESSISDISSSSSTSLNVSGSVSTTRNPRFLELEQEFSYDSSGRICLSTEENDFADKTLFVGDSICRGFSAYNIVKARNVYAAGSTGARNFFDKDFYYSGKETSYKDVLAEVAPERVILWMGMNDINMTSAAEYCENYRKIIDITLENSSASVYVCAITPINSTFAENSRIDAFNLAMKRYIEENFGQRVSFIDFAYLMKNENNQLSQGLDSGDGIHLAPECYYIAMLEICKQLNIIN